MNNHEQLQLDQLKRRQIALEEEVAALRTAIGAFERRAASRTEEGISNQSPVISPMPGDMERHLSAEVGRSGDDLRYAPKSPPEVSQASVPPPLPPVIAAPLVTPVVAPTVAQHEPAGPVPPVVPAELREEAAPAKASFEMRLGTYWLVRVGIVMLLTGLVFLGTYAYKNYIGRLGAGGKLTLLYSAGALLLGAGGWLQRQREKEGVRNYGQVLFAGGLATVYFTTYAAHYIPVLRVIASPVIDGILLFVWAMVIAAIADRRRSEVLAIFGVGLAYYTSAITDVDLFTLYSNLLLTAAALFFLVRRRWATLSIISLIATYGGFAYWRFYHGDWNWDARSTDIIPANGFLAGYWLLFTAAVFLSRSEKIQGVNRAVFAGANNGAFFGLVLLSMMHVQHGHFWEFALGFGAILLAAAAAAKRVLPDEAAVRQSYLLQGIVLITLGFIAKLAGLQLALVLAAESAVLTFFASIRKNDVLRLLALLCGTLSGLWVARQLLPGVNIEHWLLGAGVGVLLAAAAFIQHRAEPDRTTVMRPWTSLFCVLALAAWAITTWQHVPEQWIPLVFAAEAVLLTLSVCFTAVREMAFLGQGFLVVAQCAWMFRALRHDVQPWWSVVGVLAATVGLSQWWQRQRSVQSNAADKHFLQALYASAVVAMLFLWLHPKFAPSSWLAFANFIAVALTLYAILTRSWILAALSQAFTLIGAWEFMQQLISGKPEWYFALAPIVTWLLLGTMTAAWIARRPNTPAGVVATMTPVTMLYQWVAVGMSLWWIHIYFEPRFQFITLITVGAALIGFASWRRMQSVLLFSAAYFMAGLVTVLVQLIGDAETGLHAWNLIALVVVLVLQQVLRRTRAALPPNTHEVAIATTAAVLWLFISRWVSLKAGGGHVLTASWAGLAFLLFSSGFVLRERMYRWFGLAILACAVTRVFVFDVWKLETIYRILSFMALGIVLLVLGFIYNKYQDKWREWL